MFTSRKLLLKYLVSYIKIPQYHQQLLMMSPLPFVSSMAACTYGMGLSPGESISACILCSLLDKHTSAEFMVCDGACFQLR